MTPFLTRQVYVGMLCVQTVRYCTANVSFRSFRAALKGHESAEAQPLAWINSHGAVGRSHGSSPCAGLDRSHRGWHHSPYDRAPVRSHIMHVARQCKPVMARQFMPEVARPCEAPMARIMPLPARPLSGEPPAPLLCTLTLTGIAPTGTRTSTATGMGKGAIGSGQRPDVFVVVN